MISFSFLSATALTRRLPRLERHAGRFFGPRLSLITVLALAGVTGMSASHDARAAFVDADADTDPSKQSLLQADEVSYDQDNNIVTALGHVEIQHDDRILLADK